LHNWVIQTEALKRMDLSRGKIYQGWTKDVQAIIDIKFDAVKVHFIIKRFFCLF